MDGGIKPAGEHTFFYGKGNKNHEFGIFLCIRVDFFRDRMLCIIVRGPWCHIIVLNIHAQTEDKIHDVKDNFCKEVEHMFTKFSKYHVKIMIGDFSA
jgi:hypothetical protein